MLRKADAARSVAAGPGRFANVVCSAAPAPAHAAYYIAPGIHSRARGATLAAKALLVAGKRRAAVAAELGNTAAASASGPARDA